MTTFKTSWRCCALVVLLALAGTARATPPNILVIFGDDIGYMNVSSFGGDIMCEPTPNSDPICR